MPDGSLRLERFLKLQPLVFKGSLDPKVAEDWITEVTKLFEVMQAPNEQRITLIPYILRGAADHWWKMVTRTEDVGAMTWKQLDSLFMEQYFLWIRVFGEKGGRRCRGVM